MAARAASHLDSLPDGGGTLTALGIPIEPRSELKPRPLPWRRMIWVTWRQHRLAIVGVVALFGAAAAYLLIAGVPMYGAYVAVAICHPAGASICNQAADEFLQNYAPGVGVTLGVFQALPALVGAFTGAPLLAREFETGTFRYAWTQAFERSRWTMAKLIPLGVVVMITAAAFSMVIAWYLQPIFGAGDDNGPLYPTNFDLSGVVLAGWTLVAFAIGVLAGTLLRRVIPAMFATIAVWAALAFTTGAFLRPRYEAPVVTTSPHIPTGAWVISQGWFKGGETVGLATLNQTLAPVDVRAITPTLFQPGPATPFNFGDPVQYLMQHGLTQLTTYQPASRFWTFQWIESGWLLALSLILIAVTVWLVRRRAA